MAQNDDKFDLSVVHEHFSNSLHEEDDVRLEKYLNSFEELNKFFVLMGTIFGFVSKDLKAKVEVLQEFLEQEPVSEHFKTVKTMVEYEKDNALLHKKGYTSGSRTLLRLHRGLDFIRAFLKSLGEIQDEEHTAGVCRIAYDQTLAKHHPFVIKNGARIAMYALPTREGLLKKVCGPEEHIKKNLEVLPETLQVTEIVYERIESIYTKYDLHGLP